MKSQVGHMPPTNRVDPYSKVVLTQPGSMGLGSAMQYNQQQQMSTAAGYMQMAPEQQQAYNIQPSPQQQQDQTYRYMHSPGYSQADSPYQVPQQSPDSQGFSNLNIASPNSMAGQNNLDSTIDF